MNTMGRNILYDVKKKKKKPNDQIVQILYQRGLQ